MPTAIVAYHVPPSKDIVVVKFTDDPRLLSTILLIIIGHISARGRYHGFNDTISRLPVLKNLDGRSFLLPNFNQRVLISHSIYPISKYFCHL